MHLDFRVKPENDRKDTFGTSPLSDSFTFSRLIRFTLPLIGVMIFMSIYNVIDVLFVSIFFNGKTESSKRRLYRAMIV